MKRPAHITHVNGVETSAIDIADRGLAYGDGLFETMRVVKGDVPLLSLHLARFLKGVDVLGLGDQTIMKQNFLYYLNTVLDEVKHNACFEASLIKISFQLKNDVICLSISDDGKGFVINKSKKGIKRQKD